MKKLKKLSHFLLDFSHSSESPWLDHEAHSHSSESPRLDHGAHSHSSESPWLDHGAHKVSPRHRGQCRGDSFLKKKTKIGFLLRSVLWMQVLMCSLMVSQGATADQAKIAYQEGQFNVAARTLSSQDAINNFYMGKLRLYGYGLLKNNPLALKYFTHAAQQGYLPAEQLLARYHLVAQHNPKEALLWFKKAAAHGDNAARMYCAAAYLFGYGVDKNPDTARQFYIEAAKAGDPLAQFTLANHFLESKDRNSKKLGVIWLSKAANKGYAAAIEQLRSSTDLAQSGHAPAEFPAAQPLKATTLIGWLTQNNASDFSQTPYALNGIWTTWRNTQSLKEHHYNRAPKMPLFSRTKLFTPNFSLIKPINVPISDYFDYSARTAHTTLPPLQAYPQYPLPPSIVVFQRQVSPVLKHDENAPIIFPNAVIEDPSYDSTPQEGIDFFMLLGLCPPNQKERAKFQYALLTLYNRALLGDSTAQFELGQLYQAGIGVAKNPQQAQTYYELAAAQQEVNAEYNLGLMYLLGQSATIDYKKGIDWWLDAAFKGNAYAQYALGNLYQYGLNDSTGKMLLPPNTEQSLAMYFLAASNHLGKADYQLATQLATQNQQTLSIQAKQSRRALIKQLYQEAFSSGVAEASLPLSFYQAMSDNPLEQTQAFYAAQALAAQGDADAALLLGILYDSGRGVVRNQEQALKWYVKAPKHPVTAFIIGTYAADGPEGPINKEKAFSLLNFAANQGLAEAMYNLAILQHANKESFLPTLIKAQKAGNATAGLLLADYYLNQINGLDTLANAKSIYSHFAEKGDSAAATKLGYMYEHGLGTVPDPVLAEKWYHAAAVQQQPTAQFLLGKLYQSGKLNSPQYGAAKQWYQLAVTKHYTPAATALGFLEETVHENYAEAERAYQQAALSPIACYNLALIKEYGKGTAIDYPAAFHLYQKAAEAGEPAAMAQLAHCYQQGIGTPVDNSEAKAWYEKAAQKGDAIALYHAGLLTLAETSYPNPEKAVRYLEKAIQAGNELALMKLAHLLYEGKKIPQNIDRAVALYTQAANNQNAEAAAMLAQIHAARGQTQAAKEWLEKARQAGSPQIEEKISWIKSIQEPRKSTLPIFSLVPSNSVKQPSPLNARLSGF